MPTIADYAYTPPLYNTALEPYLHGMGFPIPCLKELTFYYMEPHRYYHDWHHPNTLASIALSVYRSLDSGTISDDDFRGTQFALMFHDSVFDPKKPQQQNKADSVVRMHEMVQRYGISMSPISLAVAEAAILRTGNHFAYPDLGSPYVQPVEFFRDMDLVYLADEYEEFKQSVLGFQLEWGCIASTRYAQQISRRYLGAIVKAPQLYNTPLFYAQCEAAARTNIARYLSETADLILDEA